MHKTIIHTSFIVEIFNVLVNLAGAKNRGPTCLNIDESDTPAIDRYIALFDNQRDYVMWLHETLLVIDERSSIDCYFDALSAWLPEQLYRVFFESHIDDETLEISLADLLQSEDINISAALVDYLNHPEKLYQLTRNACREIAQIPAFSDALARADDALRQMVADMKVEVAHRHPLSYAQSLFGKSFYTIMDYQLYEFVPTRFQPWNIYRLSNQRRHLCAVALTKKPFTDDSLHDLVDATKAIGDPMRLRILQLIYGNPMYGKQISDALGIKTPTVSHHLDILHKTGWVHMEQSKHIKYFSTNQHAFKNFGMTFDQYIKSRK